MTIDFRINTSESVTLKLGETYRIESLTHAVTPDFMLVEEELELSQELSKLKQEAIPNEDLLGNIYTLEAITIGVGTITSSFKDIKSGQKILSKTVEVIVEE